MSGLAQPHEKYDGGFQRQTRGNAKASQGLLWRSWKRFCDLDFPSISASSRRCLSKLPLLKIVFTRVSGSDLVFHTIPLAQISRRVGTVAICTLLDLLSRQECCCLPSVRVTVWVSGHINTAIENFGSYMYYILSGSGVAWSVMFELRIDLAHTKKSGSSSHQWVTEDGHATVHAAWFHGVTQDDFFLVCTFGQRGTRISSIGTRVSALHFPACYSSTCICAGALKQL